MCYSCKTEMAMSNCLCQKHRCYRCYRSVKRTIECSECIKVYKQNKSKPRCSCRDFHTWGVVNCYSLDIGWGLINTTGSGPKHWYICNEHYKKQDKAFFGGPRPFYFKIG